MPSLSIGLDPDILLRLGDLDKALATSNAGIKDIERSALRAEKAGQQLDESTRNRLKQLEVVSAAASNQIAKDKALAAQMAQSKKLAAEADKAARTADSSIRGLKHLLAGEGIRHLLSGKGFTAGDAARMAVSLEREAVQITRAMGNSLLAKSLQAGARNLPLIGQLAAAGSEFIGTAQKKESDAKSFGLEAFQGKRTAEESEYFNKRNSSMFNFNAIQETNDLHTTARALNDVGVSKAQGAEINYKSQHERYYKGQKDVEREQTAFKNQGDVFFRAKMATFADMQNDDSFYSNESLFTDRKELAGKRKTPQAQQRDAATSVLSKFNYTKEVNAKIDSEKKRTGRNSFTKDEVDVMKMQVTEGIINKVGGKEGEDLKRHLKEETEKIATETWMNSQAKTKTEIDQEARAERHAEFVDNTCNESNYRHYQAFRVPARFGD